MSEAPNLDRSKLEALEGRVKRLMIRELRLKQTPESIQAEAPLFEEGLNLDSIDALQLIVVLEKEFGMKIETQDEAMQIMKSVRAIARHILDLEAAESSAS